MVADTLKNIKLPQFSPFAVVYSFYCYTFATWLER